MPKMPLISLTWCKKYQVQVMFLCPVCSADSCTEAFNYIQHENKRRHRTFRTQNKGEVSIWGVEILYIQVSFGPQKITVECKLWCQNSLWYVCSKSPLNHTHVLCVASCGIKWYVLYVLPLFVRSLHVAAFLWAWHICRIRKAN